MNILLNIHDFKLEDVFLMESKENIIINGIFVKILYSPEYFTMNGIFLDFPVKNFERKNFNGKNVVFFDIKENLDLISQFSKIETDILSFYIKNGDNIKKKINTIGTQLRNGMMKYYNYISSTIQNRFYIKISGVWETASDIGITYKLIYY